jgi:hypothetical protein
MAGTVVTSEETFGTVKKVIFSWTSSTGGLADAVTLNAYSGAIQRLITIPSTSSAPTALYDIVVNDDTADVLMGAGANRSATLTEQVLASSLGIVANDVLTLGITNAGNAGSGTVLLYIR